MTEFQSALIGHMMNALFALESGTKREAMGILRRGIQLARDSDSTATAAPCGDMAVPQDLQARAESIAKGQDA